MFFAAVFLIGLPAMLKNWTSVALVLAWGLNEGLWLATGKYLPLQAYIATDFMVLVVIFLKRDAQDSSPFTGLWHQLGACWREREWGDRVVAAIFPVMWIIYVLAMDDLLKYWILWGLALGQFVAAGAEAFVCWRRGRQAAEKPSPDIGTRWQGLAGYV